MATGAGVVIEKYKWTIPCDPNDWRTHVEKCEAEIERLTAVAEASGRFFSTKVNLNLDDDEQMQAFADLGRALSVLEQT